LPAFPTFPTGFSTCDHANLAHFANLAHLAYLLCDGIFANLANLGLDVSLGLNFVRGVAI
jgi:hypothetical protein